MGLRPLRFLHLPHWIDRGIGAPSLTAARYPRLAQLHGCLLRSPELRLGALQPMPQDIRPDTLASEGFLDPRDPAVGFVELVAQCGNRVLRGPDDPHDTPGRRARAKEGHPRG